MDAFSRGLNKARYQNAYDIAQKLNLKLPKVNTTAYFIQGFNISRANATNITDDVDPVDAPSDTAITSLVSKFKYSLASSKNVSLAAETEYVKDQLETVSIYETNLNSNPTNQVLVNAFINNTQLVKDGFLEKFDNNTWAAPIPRKIHNHVNTFSNSSANTTSNTSNQTNNTSSPSSNSTVSSNTSNATAPVPSEALAAPASVISRKGNKV